MLRWLKILCVVSCVFHTSHVLAKPMTWVSEIQFDPMVSFTDVGMGGVQMLTFTHDLMGIGYVPGLDQAHSFTLFLAVLDDERNDFSEWGRVYSNGLRRGYRSIEAEYVDVVIIPQLFKTELLSMTGLLELEIRQREGDFNLFYSRLVVEGHRPVQVKEPTTFMLFLMAIIVLAYHRLRAI